MEQTVFFGLFLAGLLGGLIGIERETPHSKTTENHVVRFGWIRSYALIGLFGALCTWIDLLQDTNIWMILGWVLSGIFVAISYVYASFRKDYIGITSEYAALLVYLVGVIVMLGHWKVAIVFTVFLMMILALKEHLQRWREKISRAELGNTIKFAVIAFVILPILPSAKFSFAEIMAFLSNGAPVAEFAMNQCRTGVSAFFECIWYMKFFNPYSIWFFVVIMAAVEYAGYVLSKIIGSKGGILASGAIGGLVSSTATTAAMTKKSTEDIHNRYPYILATLLANSIMFIRVIVITAFFAPFLLGTILIPAIVMLAVFLISIGYFLHRSHKEGIQAKKIRVEQEFDSPFQIGPALKFAIFILFIKFISGAIQLFEIKSLYYLLAVVSGFADVDAITQDMATKAHEGMIIPFVATTSILIAVMSNNIVKGSIAWRFGEREFGRSVLGTFVLSMILGIITIVLMGMFL